MTHERNIGILFIILNKTFSDNSIIGLWNTFDDALKSFKVFKN